MKRHILVIFSIFLTMLLNAANPLSPSNLRCCDKINPVGTDKNPYFGWAMSDYDNNEVQTAYQIIVSASQKNINDNKGDICNTGKIEGSMQNFISLRIGNILPATRYFWKVRVWDKDGNVSDWSKFSVFETGLFDNADWKEAIWIKRQNEDTDDYSYFRKQIKLSGRKIQRATAYISACHSYELFVNGKFTGEGHSFHYPQYSYYKAIDITDFVKPKSINTLAIFTHWDGGGQGRAKGNRGFIMKAIIEYTDNTVTIIGSDSTWKTSRAEMWVKGQGRRNGEGVGYIEMIDAAKISTDWYMPDFNDKGWVSAAEIGSHPVNPWTGVLRPDLTGVVKKAIKPLSVKKLAEGSYIIDLGKVYAGNFKINFTGGSAGDTVKMMGGYIVGDNGKVNTRYNQGTKLDFYFIHNGKTAVFRPFNYYGMRYLQVDNSPCELNVNNVSFITRHYEFDSSRSSFTSSDKTLNNVWDLMQHSLLVGSQEGFVDTPTREKGAFLGDGWSQGVPAMSTMGDRTMNNRILREFLDSQEQYWPDGRLNAVYPNADGGRDIPDYTQSYLVWVWDYYMQTGNVRFLRDNYSQIKKVADYVDKYRDDSTGLIFQLAGGNGAYKYGIIDWPADMRYGYDMNTDSRTVINAYAYACYDVVSKIAEVLGIDGDVSKYSDLAVGMKQSINKHLINDNGVYIDGLFRNGAKSNHVSQHANMFPLAMGLVDNMNFKNVLGVVKDKKMSVGMVTLRWLPEALGLSDEGEHLYELYTNSDWDGWAKTIADGGTVTWESWNAKQAGESMSHPWGAAGLLAMQQYMIGIKTLQPQNSKVLIKPLDFGSKLNWVKGVYPTDRGDIKVEWSRSDEGYDLSITIPDNISAVVEIPQCGKTNPGITVNGVRSDFKISGKYISIGELGSGEYTVSLR